LGRPLTLSGTLTLRSPQGREVRLTAQGASLTLHLQGLRTLQELGTLAPGQRGRAHFREWLVRGLEEADVTLYVRLWGRTLARRSPRVRHGLLGRLTGFPGLRLTPVAFLFQRPPTDVG
jgi:hypothetical protein